MNKLLACTTALLLLAGTGTAVADDREGWNEHRGHSGFDHERHDNGRGLAWGRRDRVDHFRHEHRRDNDHVSVSLSFGNVWQPAYRDYHRNSFNTFGIGNRGFDSWGFPDDSWGYNSRRPVVVYQNTYSDNPAPRSRVNSRTMPRSGTSLLRDVQGRCFERETDRYGNETRTELPASACDF